jgi:hypothetical protein
MQASVIEASRIASSWKPRASLPPAPTGTQMKSAWQTCRKKSFHLI